MRILAALALVGMLGGCAFAVRHPAITSGLAGAVIAGATCELTTHNGGDGGGGEEKACAVVTGAVGLGLALVVAAAIYFGGDGHTILVEEPLTEPPAPLHTFKHASDAGVDAAGELDAAVPPVPADAGM